MIQLPAPYVLTRDNCAAFWTLGTLWMPLATGALTGNSMTVLEQLMPDQSGPGSHLHTQDEGFYIIEGGGTFNAGGQSVHARAGTLIHIPRHTSHSFVTDTNPTRALNFYLPSGFEHIMLSAGAPAQTREMPAMDAVPMPPPAFINELSREYGQSKDLAMPWVDEPTPANRVTKPSATNPVAPFGTHVAQAPAYWQQDILWTMLATGEQTGGTYAAIEQLCRQGSGPIAHWHEQDEALYILQGEATFLAGDQQFQVGAGAWVWVPRGTVHSFRVDSETVRLLNFYTPAGFEQLITQTARPAAARTLPPTDLSADGDREKMEALFARIGMHTVAIPDFLREGKSGK